MNKHELKKRMMSLGAERDAVTHEMLNLAHSEKFDERVYNAHKNKLQEVDTEIENLRKQMPENGLIPAADGNTSGREFSLTRAVLGQIPGAGVDSGYEREVSAELKNSLRDRGVEFPENAIVIPTGTVSGGPQNSITSADVPGHEVTRYDRFIDVLRKRSAVLNQPGVVTLPNLTGKVVIPRQTAAGAPAWIDGDGVAALTIDNAEFDSVVLEPHFVGTLQRYSIRALHSVGNPLEDILRRDLMNSLAEGLDLGAVTGDGESNRPTGILETTGINSETYAGDLPTFAELVAMESRLAASDADAGTLAYLGNSEDVVALKSEPKVSGQPIYINEAGRINGYAARGSNQVPAGTFVFGNWQDAIFGFWGGIALLVNPYQAGDYEKGLVRVRGLMAADFAVRRPASFEILEPGE